MSKPFEAEQVTLEELMGLGSTKTYAIPLYQRRYVWRNDQNAKLWEDVVECYENNSNHFLGSLVLMDYEKDSFSPKNQADVLFDNSFEVHHIVDGQQRITSLSLIMAALYHDMYEQDSMFDSLPDLDAQLKQDWSYLQTKMRTCLITDVRDKTSKSGKGYIPRLVPVAEIYEQYKAIVNNERFGKQLLIERAFHFYLDELTKLRKEVLRSTNPDSSIPTMDSADAVLGFYDGLYRAVARQIKIVQIDCAAGEDAFQVFESLNGTGLSLTSSDRIKNILMGRAASENNPLPISSIQSQWSTLEHLVSGQPIRATEVDAFFSAYMFVVNGERVPKKQLTQTFTTLFLDKHSNCGGIRKALSTLIQVAKCYQTIVRREPYENDKGELISLDPKLKKTIEGILRNNPSQSIVPMLAAAIKYGIGDKRFADICSALLVLLVRHKVCNQSTNKLDTIFAQFCSDVEENDSIDKPLETLLRKTPSDKEFEISFARLDFDSGRNAELARARYYLESIENYLRAKSGNDALNSDEDYTLEHIIPQEYDYGTWFENYPAELEKFNNPEYNEAFSTNTVQSIGNMCLLRRPENSSAGNRAFKSKLECYKKPDTEGKTASETFQLVAQVVENEMKDNDAVIKIVDDGETFGPESVNKRARVLARYATNIWKL